MSPKRKRRDGEATREKLIAATIDLLSKEGLSHISTSRITEKAGIVQSGFYAHFSSIEACILIAAKRIGKRIREPIVELMSRLRREGPEQPEVLTAHFVRVLKLLEPEWQFVDLFIRYRRDPSALGRLMGKLEDQIHNDIVDHLLAAGGVIGLEEGHRPAGLLFAHLVTSMLLASLEASENNLSDNRELLAKHLALQTHLLSEFTYNTLILNQT